MSDESVPPKPPSQDPGQQGAGAPPPPPAGSPPPPPVSPGGAAPGGNRGLMLVLSYLWILALVPYLTEQQDPEVKWHARHGLVLMIAEILLSIVIFILSLIPAVGCVISILWLFAWIGIVVLHILCIVKATSGQRLIIPYVSQYADQIP